MKYVLIIFLSATGFAATNPFACLIESPSESLPKTEVLYSCPPKPETAVVYVVPAPPLSPKVETVPFRLEYADHLERSYVGCDPNDLRWSYSYGLYCSDPVPESIPLDSSCLDLFSDPASVHFEG